MRVMVTGARGLLGSAIVREFSDSDLHACGHEGLDIADESAVIELTRRIRPDVVINCAAYNDVDRAEQESQAALRVNAFGVLALARAAREVGAVLVHYSTDFVFDGETDRPYTEEDAPNPRSIYAASKLIGEWFAQVATRAYVLRVVSLFGEPAADGSARQGSLGKIVERIQQGEEVPVFIDRTVSPTNTSDIACATRLLIERCLPTGLYHCVNEGAEAWVAIGEEAARLMGRPFRMKPMTLESANLSAVRPRYSALSARKLAGLGITMPTWRDALKKYLLAHP